jgi:alkylhydroperoxidase family enzyme
MGTPEREPPPTLTRIAPSPWRELGLRARAAARISAWATHGEPPHVLTTLGRHRELFRRWLPLGGWLLMRTDLPRADVELVILRTAWNCEAWYEWVQHIPLAMRAGIGGESIRRMSEGSEAGWTRRQRSLLRATDELHQHRVITDGTWTVLASDLSDRELTELCFLVGHYEMLAMTLNSLGVEPEETALHRLNDMNRAQALDLRERLVRARRRGQDAST